MKKAILIVLVTVLAVCVGCDGQHRYQIERVKDGNGNDAFLRIDVTSGTECAVGSGFAIVRYTNPEHEPDGSEYLVPFCGSAK